MGIRKPSLSVKEARTLASVRSTASQELGALSSPDQVPDAPALPIAGSANQSRKSGDTWQRRPAGNDISETGKPAPKKPGAAASSKSSGMSSDKVGPSALTGAQDKGVVAESPFPTSRVRRDKVQVFLSAPFPAAGVSPTFELLCKQYSPHKALQMILRKALHSYERLLADGTFQRVAQTYDVDVAAATEAVQTSRMMPNRLVVIARAHFDPLGLESTRAFGRKLGMAALAAFFTNERALRQAREGGGHQP
ncbi:VirC2 family conjugal transfer protein [Rhizobium sp. BT-226]|uniref:VirC2 family conjugal transfer protein n=1 Tax=Rhizobium sp. BT-226 TaxID=2986922 RepID=UPI0021F72F26|nr:VirC2 family conjugal transfer protein [Rhizobium sp. BT-226]MCW0021370.1 VirC2 family conjugal transfer protein [Rhizobium sp. BT-226]